MTDRYEVLADLEARRNVLVAEWRKRRKATR